MAGVGENRAAILFLSATLVLSEFVPICRADLSDRAIFLLSVYRLSHGDRRCIAFGRRGRTYKSLTGIFVNSAAVIVHRLTHWTYSSVFVNNFGE